MGLFPFPFLAFLPISLSPWFFYFLLSSFGDLRPAASCHRLVTRIGLASSEGPEVVRLSSVADQTLALRMSSGKCEARIFMARKRWPTTIFNGGDTYQLIQLKLFFNMVPLVSDESGRIVGILWHPRSTTVPTNQHGSFQRTLVLTCTLPEKTS